MSKVGAVAGTMILAGSGMFVALPAMAEEAPSSAGVEAAAAVAQEGEASEASQTAVPQKVEGTFSYSQDVITDNATITNVFKKAMATLCTGLPQYAVQEVQTMSDHGRLDHRGDCGGSGIRGRRSELHRRLRVLFKCGGRRRYRQR
ncbi:MAG: hypothetical protein ACLSDQ_01675 [Adlercreutzia equolifaciens]